MNEDSHSSRVGYDVEQTVTGDPLWMSMDGSRAEGSPIVGTFLSSGRDDLSSCAPADVLEILCFVNTFEACRVPQTLEMQIQAWAGQCQARACHPSERNGLSMASPADFDVLHHTLVDC